jgi:hypothetical protein
MSLNPQHRHKGDGKAAQHVQGDQPAGDDVLRKPDACREVRQADAHDAALDPLHVSDRTQPRVDSSEPKSVNGSRGR